MGTVLPFKANATTDSPHAAGAAQCIACKHEWAAVAPIPSDGDRLECPACGLQRGAFKFPFHSGADDDFVWVCKCGSTLMQVIVKNRDARPSYMCCTGCGARPSF